MIMLQAKPSLADQNVILVFVIGGINGVEVNFLSASLPIFYFTSPHLFPFLCYLALLVWQDSYHIVIENWGNPR